MDDILVQRRKGLEAKFLITRNFGYSEISAGGTGMKPASLSQTLSDIGAGSLADDVEDYPQTDTDYLRTQRDAD